MRSRRGTTASPARETSCTAPCALRSSGLPSRGPRRPTFSSTAGRQAPRPARSVGGGRGLGDTAGDRSGPPRAETRTPAQEPPSPRRSVTGVLLVLVVPAVLSAASISGETVEVPVRGREVPLTLY